MDIVRRYERDDKVRDFGVNLSTVVQLVCY